MFEEKMKLTVKKLIPLVALVLIVATTGSGQPRSLQAQDQMTTQPALAEDPIEQLRLTPDQRQRIRLIFNQNKDERQLANRRVREANIALDQALDTDPIDESVIEQRVNDLAAAQAAQTRMRIHTELRVRRELRPDQLAILRRLRLQVRDVMAPQRPLNQRPARQGLRPQIR
jgi:Spy/CpxP family protein refolding chaperone